MNTTISAIVTLQELSGFPVAVAGACEQRRDRVGGDLGIDERMVIFNEVQNLGSWQEPPMAVRVRVLENPFARAPLPGDAFRGPFDERWGRRGDFIERVFVGDALAELEGFLPEYALQYMHL